MRKQSYKISRHTPFRKIELQNLKTPSLYKNNLFTECTLYTVQSSDCNHTENVSYIEREVIYTVQYI